VASRARWARRKTGNFLPEFLVQEGKKMTLVNQWFPIVQKYRYDQQTARRR